MFRVRTLALSLAATGAAALTLGLVAGPAVAHGFGHHGFRAHHGHALSGVVQSVDTSANTAVITLGGEHGLRRDWDHGGTPSSGTQQVTLDLSGASIFDAAAMKRDCHTGAGSSATPATLSAVQPGDVVTAVLAVSHSTARQDVESGAALPVSKLFDWGAPSATRHAKASNARRFGHR
ncbi:MAG: hypothetical protein ACXVVQ_04430 [Solirubrobacteraceae bacterium]